MSQTFLNEIRDFSADDIANILAPFIFEYESSIARYPLLFWINNNDFKKWFIKNLDEIREKTWKKIILLATTKSKLESIQEEEFWIKKWENIDSKYIKENSWFDNLWWPKELEHYYNNIEKWEESNYIFFTRASIDTEWLKNQNKKEKSEILENDDLRKFLKENTITINIDNPNDKNTIPVNDTKEYMEDLWLWYFFTNINEIFSEELIEYLKTKEWRAKGFSWFKWYFYKENLKNFLISSWVNEDELKTWKVIFRFKPVYESYWAYSQLASNLNTSKERKKLENISDWKKFLLQLERPTKKIINENTWKEYLAIHRLFPYSDKEGEIYFNKSIINLMPINEKQKNTPTVHWGKTAEWWEII